MDRYVTVMLPSRGLPYEHGRGEVEIRTMKGEDEKVLAELSVDNFDKKSAELLNRCVKGGNVIDFTIGDRLFLLIWQAINSYSPLYPVDLVCPQCFQKIMVDVDLSKLEVIYLPEDYKQPYPVQLSDREIKLRLLTVRDEIAINEYGVTGQSTWLYRFAITIVSDSSVEDKVKMLEQMGTKDLSLIRAFHEKFVHGLDMNYKYQCPKCLGGDTLIVPFRLEMFLPTGTLVARASGVEI